MARDNPVSGFISFTQNGLPQARSNRGLISRQIVRQDPQQHGEAQGQPHCPPLFIQDPKTGNFVDAGKEIHEAVLRTYPIGDVKNEGFISPDSRSECRDVILRSAPLIDVVLVLAASDPVHGRILSQPSNVNHLKMERSECRRAETIDDIQDPKQEEHGDEEDLSQDLSDVEEECRLEDRWYPVRADEVDRFVRVLFRYGIQQKGCKKILQYWIKMGHPKKQATHPYNGGQKQRWSDDDNKGQYTAPPYWPSQLNWSKEENTITCRHKEPDHLRKWERLNLCCHLLAVGKLDEYDFSVDLLEESTETLTETHHEHFQPRADQHLRDIYNLRRHQISFKDGQIDGDSKIRILMPRKANIKITIKPRQQLPKKARPTLPAVKPKVKSLSTMTSKLNTAFRGHDLNDRQIKMETETIILRSSSLHAATSPADQSADDDEHMTTEPCSSLTSPMATDMTAEHCPSLASPMATDIPTGSGNGNSFGQDSYTSSCKPESHDVSMKYQPKIKAEEQEFRQNPWSCGNSTDMSLASSSAYVIQQQALQNSAFDHGSYNHGANNVFGAMPGSQDAGLSSGVPKLGSPGYGENHMFDPWPLQRNGFSNGAKQSSHADPYSSHTSPYDSNQFNPESYEHLVDPAWYETYLDMQNYGSSVNHSGYNEMHDTQMLCADQLHHGPHSTAAERRQLYTTGDWPSSAQV